MLFLIGRLICGICGGVSCVLTPIYVAEIASKEIRGRLLAFFQLLVNCGVMYAFYVAHAIDEQRSVWRYIHEYLIFKLLWCVCVCVNYYALYIQVRKSDVVKVNCTTKMEMKNMRKLCLKMSHFNLSRQISGKMSVWNKSCPTSRE